MALSRRGWAPHPGWCSPVVAGGVASVAWPPCLAQYWCCSAASPAMASGLRSLEVSSQALSPLAPWKLGLMADGRPTCCEPAPWWADPPGVWLLRPLLHRGLS